MQDNLKADEGGTGMGLSSQSPGQSCPLFGVSMEQPLQVFPNPFPWQKRSAEKEGRVERITSLDLGIIISLMR